MAETSGIVTLDYVLKTFLNWKGWGTADYDRYKQLLIGGFTDLNIFHTEYYREFIGTVNGINQMQIPADYIDWKRVAVELQGEYWTLSINDKIITEPSSVATVAVYEQHLESPKVNGYKYTSRRRNPLGQFKINKKDRVCTFIGDMSGKSIYLLYSSSGIPESGDVFVPRELVTTLRTYLEWQLKEADDSIGIGVKQRAEQQHGNALGLYYEWKDQLSGDELLDLFRDGLTQGVKR